MIRRWRCHLFHRTHFGHKCVEDHWYSTVRVRTFDCRWCGRRWQTVERLKPPGEPPGWPRFRDKEFL
jgi:hypothetical protein